MADWGDGGWSPALVAATSIALAVLVGSAWRSPERCWWQLATFLAGGIVLGLAGSPLLEPLARHLVSAHMLQYLLLSNVVPPLLVLGWPRAPLAAPTGSFGLLAWLFARVPVVVLAGALDVLVLFGWHVPSVYAAALRLDWLHGLQQVSFLGAGLLFWLVIRHPGAGRAHYASTLACILLTALPSSALGLILFSARAAWYTAALGPRLPWGLDALQDQQLAGLILGIPPDTLDVISAIGVIIAWLRAEERRVIEREHWG